MSALLVPEGCAGVNLFSRPDWWEARAADRDVERRPHGVAVEDPDLPWEGERSLLVVGPLRTWTPPGPADDRLRGLLEWREAVLTLAAEAPSETVRLVGLPSAPSGYAQLVALAAGHRWPAPDLAEAARHDIDEAVVPSLDETAAPDPTGTELGVALRDFAAALADTLRPGVRPSWVTQAIGATDAVEVLRSGVDADPALAPDEARTLRRESRATLQAFAAAGIAVGGRRDLLLWPEPVVHGRVPLDVAAEVAAEMLRGQVERPTEWPVQLDRINDLERSVEALRAEVAEVGARGPGLGTLSGRDLVRRLRGSAR